jgi:hypothetical protein
MSFFCRKKFIYFLFLVFLENFDVDVCFLAVGIVSQLQNHIFVFSIFCILWEEKKWATLFNVNVGTLGFVDGLVEHKDT